MQLHMDFRVDSSCGCWAVSPITTLCSQWDFSLPALVLQLTSPPTLGLFHLPLGLAEAAAAPRPSFGCLCRPELHTAAAPLFWGASPVRARASRTGLPCQQQWSCADPHPVGLICLCLFPSASSPSQLPSEHSHRGLFSARAAVSLVSAVFTTCFCWDLIVDCSHFRAIAWLLSISVK